MQDDKKTPRESPRVTLYRVIVVLLLVAGCTFAIYRLHLRSRLNARIEAIRAAGYPVTLIELDKWYSIPDDAENAAYTITDAFSHYISPHYTQFVPLVGPVELPPRTEPLAEDTMGFAGLHIVENKKALELLHTGAAIENCRYPIDFAAGIDTGMSHLSEIRKGVMLLELESILHAEKGESALAVQSITAALGIARSLENEPSLVSQLARNGCQRLTVSGLERTINRTELTDEQLAGLSRALIDAEELSVMARALRGERCFALSVLTMSAPEMAHILPLMSSGKPQSKVTSHLQSAKFTLHRFAGLTDRSTIVYLDLIKDYIDATQLPLEGRLAAIEQINGRCTAASRAYFLLRDLTDGLPRVNTIIFRGFATLRAAWAALAVHRYRLATGRLPDALTDIVPEYIDSVPVDPFDGGEMRYKKLGVGFVVYSVGEDLSDDGGKARPPNGKTNGQSRNWDVTFVVER